MGRRLKAKGKKAGRKPARSRPVDAASGLGEERHRRLVERSPVGIFMTDAKGAVTYVNPRIAQITGYPQEIMLRRGWHDILHEDDRDRVIRAWEQGVARGEEVELEVHVRRPDGGEVWLLSEAHPEHDEAGRLTGFIGTVSDISEIKFAEFALKASEERFRAMVDSSPAAVFLTDVNGAVTYSNAASAAMLGQDWRRGGGSNWMAVLQPDARDPDGRRLRAAIRRGESWSGSGQFERGDGRVVWCEVRTAPVRVDGRLVGHVCTAVDVSDKRRAETELRESETRYRALFEQNPNPMCLYDRETLRFLGVNDAMVDHYGYTREEFLEMDIRDIRPPEDVPKLLSAVDRTIRELTTAGIFRHRKKNGEIIDVEVRSRATELSGRVVVLALLSDVTERLRAERALALQQSALAETTARLNHLLATSPTILYSTRYRDGKSMPMWISDSVTRLLGYSPEEAMAPEWWIRHLHPEDRQRVVANIPQLVALGFQVNEYRFLTKAGDALWIRDESRVLNRHGARDVDIVGTWSDITERRVFEERLRLDAAAIESTRDGVMIADLDGTIVSVNRSFRLTVGYEERELLGRTPKILQSGRHGPDFYRAMWHDILTDGYWQGEVWNRRKNGEVFPVWVSISAVHNELGRPTHYVAVYTDISKLKQSEEELEQLAHFDPLTQLPNRLLLQSRLEHAVDQARRRERLVGVLFIDLDDFKKVNDSLGHIIGDELLVAVANRLGERVRGEDTLARLGGDEFVVLLEQLERPEDSATVANALLAALATPITLSSGHELYAQASIGISIFPDDASSPAELLREADTAMYRAKDAGGNRFLFFTGDMGEQVLVDLELENALRQALERKELALHFQPKIELPGGRIYGAEALLRWQRGGAGYVPPNKFIPIAEKTGLIVPIGTWVIDSALAQLRRWLDEGLPEIHVAVNVSALQFRSGDLDAVITSLLARHGLPPHVLTLELTESLLMEQPEETTRILRRLKQIGVMLSLDDFGTGFSSLTYLTRFPMDTLKIDASFVQGIGSDESSMTVINSVIELAHRMRMHAVAEGVETVEQLQYMKEQGCDAIQGYYFSRPVPADEFAKLLRKGTISRPDN
jgi:diguanylate cyclase (GGDEF)-like protein/PAS domain S-box-containing protein